MKKSLFKKTLATALSVVMALGSSIYAFAEGETTTTTPTLKVQQNSSDVSSITCDLASTENTTKTCNVTAKGGTGTATVESDNAEIATATFGTTWTDGANTLTIKGIAPGKINVTVTYGDLEKVIPVTVKAKAVTATAKKISDKAITDSTTTLTGATVWAGGDKTNKVATLYSNVTAGESDPNYEDAKVVKKANKVYAIVSDSSVTAVDNTVESGKPKKFENAAKILKAKYKVEKGSTTGGTLTLTAGNEVGTVKVWVVEVDTQNKVVSYAVVPVEVLGAAQKLVLTKDDVTTGSGETAKVTPFKELTAEKKISIADKNTANTFNFGAYLKDSATLADSSSTYKVEVADTSVVSADFKKKTDGKYDYSKFDIKGLKPGTTKVTITCNQSGKKVTVTVTVTNKVSKIATVLKAATGDALKDQKTDQYLGLKGDSVTIDVTETTVFGTTDAPIATTDKVKVYVVEPGAPASGSTAYTDGLKVTKNTETGKYTIDYKASKAVKAAYKEGVLTVTRTDPFLDAQVWFVYTDAASKVPYAYKAIDVEGIKITKSYITCTPTASN